MLLSSISLMSPWQSFVNLFADMSPVVYVLFIIGLVLCCIELCMPGFGIFGGAGVVAIVAAIIIRMVQGGDLWMLFYMLTIAIALFITMAMLTARSIRKGRLSKSAMFNVDSAVPMGATEGTGNYTHLLGLTGVTTTMLRPVGQAEIGGELVQVVAKSSFVDEGVDITVISVEGGTVKVQPTK